jgi:hypothetical protein
MIKYYCDICKGEGSKNDMYSIDIVIHHDPDIHDDKVIRIYACTECRKMFAQKIETLNWADILGLKLCMT